MVGRNVLLGFRSASLAMPWRSDVRELLRPPGAPLPDTRAPSRPMNAAPSKIRWTKSLLRACLSHRRSGKLVECNFLH